MSAVRTALDKCIHCGMCTANCGFLKKYNIEIGNIDILKELSFHCFLCGTCRRVCPEGIDGREVILELRREKTSSEKGRNEIRSAFSATLNEKADYRFRNYKRATEGAVFFPGCNMPSLFPRTAEFLSQFLYREYGIGTVFECCGKPVAEMGLVPEEQHITDTLRRNLGEHGITEIITACPNCKSYLQDRIDIRITDIYSKLNELGIGKRLKGDKMIYIPCPDREDRAWLKAAAEFVDGKCTVTETVNCCGLGGQASKLEKEAASAFTDILRKEAEGQPVSTYCASCVGAFRRNEYDVSYLLTEILGISETAETRSSYLNRVKTRYKKW